MSMQQTIEEKLKNNLRISHLEVLNESNNHNVPPGSESHFKVVVTTNDFDGKTPLGRHRMVNTILSHELASGIHALSIHAYTESEWNEKGATPASPPCMGGGKKE